MNEEYVMENEQKERKKERKKENLEKETINE